MAGKKKDGGFKQSVTAGSGKQGFAKSKAAPKPAKSPSKGAKSSKKDTC